MNSNETRQGLGMLTLGALGVVYGDIGTSPLYTMKEVFNPAHGVTLDAPNIIGAVSVIFWALMFGACQATCRLVHAASGCLSMPFKCALMMESRSGLSVTTSTGFQLRVWPDQRAGLAALASVYSAWRAARMA